MAVSFESPEYTADVGGMGTLRLLEVSLADGLAQAYQDFVKNHGSQRPAASR